MLLARLWLLFTGVYVFCSGAFRHPNDVGLVIIGISYAVACAAAGRR